MRVLLIEDEPKVAMAIVEGLEAEGFEVTRERTSEDGLFRVCTETFDIVLLDLGLPGRDGISMLRAMRERRIATRVLILTARDTVTDRVTGLDAGADDYLVKPFAFAELLARVRALVRRMQIPQASLVVADLRIDLLTRTVERSGQAIELTTREFELLEYLARHAGEVVPRESLANHVWKETARSFTLDNVIDVHVARLRRKVDRQEPKLLQTVRGIGFVLGNRRD
jgi:DNA-binding response OmpR family regulator